MVGVEAKIERWVCAQAEARYGVISIKLGISGWPDRMHLIAGGRPFLIEYKAPGQAPRPRQDERIKTLERLGYDVEVHDNRDEAIAAIERRVFNAKKK